MCVCVCVCVLFLPISSAADLSCMLTCGTAISELDSGPSRKVILLLIYF